MLNRLLQLHHRGRLILFSLVAAAMLGLGVANAWSTLELVRSGDRVTGTVVDSLRSTSDGETEHRAIVEYEIDGETYRHTVSKQTASPPRDGQERELLVASDDPRDARATGFGELWLGTVALLLFGVLLVGALAYTVWGRTWLRERRQR